MIVADFNVTSRSIIFFENQSTEHTSHARRVIQAWHPSITLAVVVTFMGIFKLVTFFTRVIDKQDPLLPDGVVFILDYPFCIKDVG